ncbi:hypothetical protein [Paenibacillus sp. A3]
MVHNGCIVSSNCNIFPRKLNLIP